VYSANVNRMSRLLISSLLLLVLQGIPDQALAKFGKNKIQYQTMDWKYLQTKHFDIYFYTGGHQQAVFAAEIIEKAYRQIAFQLNWRLSKRVPVIIYNSHNDFQQTNVTLGYLYEGIGGFTELFKNRVVVPFEGSFEQFRHVLHHELTHAMVNDMIFGGNAQSVFTGQMRINIPLWLSEGYAEYSSLDWDSRADMIIRDVVLNDRLPSIDDLSGYMAYKGGQSVLRYIGETYGVQRIGELLHSLKQYKNINEALHKTLGMGPKQLTEKWRLELRKEYWPDIAGRHNLDDIGERLTDHEELENYFNVSPAIAPNGGKIAFLSDRSGYADIYLMNPEKPQAKPKRIVSGQRTPDLEELKWLSPSISWAPDNRRIVFAAKAGERDALVIYDTKVQKRKVIKLPLDGVYTASWSPKGDLIAFSGLYQGQRDLYLYDLKREKLQRLTQDPFNDTRPSWSPDGKQLVFVSDRQDVLRTDFADWTGDQVGRTMVKHNYRHTDVYLLDLHTRKLTRITRSPGDEDSPIFSHTKPMIVYTSDRSGIWNIYVYDLETKQEYPLTDVYTGIFQLSLSGDDSRLVFSGYYKGGWDIYSVSNPWELERPKAPLPLSSYLKRKNLQFNLSYRDSLPKLPRVNISPFVHYVFAPGNPIPITDTSDFAALQADSAYLDSNGNYKIHPYKTRFTVDLVDGQAGFSNFFGLQGNAILAFSDILGNHRVTFGFELYRNLENSDLFLGYDFLEKRPNYHLRLFNYPDDYQIGYYRFLHFRQYGSLLGIDYPLNKFNRLEGYFTWMNLYRRDYVYVGYNEVRVLDESTLSFYLPEFHWSFDNVLYGPFYPIDGWRWDVGVVAAPHTVTSTREFITVKADIRRYFKLSQDYSLAFRLSGASSHGPTPQSFMAGGVDNWINYRVNFGFLDTLNYEDLYFSEYVTPVRSAPYFALVGEHYVLVNAEFRFPFIQYLLMRWPFSLAFANIQGLLFSDYVKVWRDSEFTHIALPERIILDGRSYSSSGFGIRLNLGIFLFRYDLAYNNEHGLFHSPPYHLFSLGLDF